MRLYNRHVHNGKAMGHWWIDVEASPATLNQVRGIDFDLDKGKIVPHEAYAAKVTVLGAAISAGGAYDMPVTVSFKIASQTFTPFGPLTQPVPGNVNDDANPRHFIFPATFEPGTPITVYGKSWLKRRRSYRGTRNRHWRGCRTAG